jgi:hypothetical protein
VEWKAARGELGNQAAPSAAANSVQPALAKDSTDATPAPAAASAESLGRRFKELSTEQDARAQLARRVKERFSKLMAGGQLSPNEAAAAALKWAVVQH